MEIKATLNKPYSDKQRMDFIVEYNHNLGYEIQETEEALQALDYDDEEKMNQRKQQMRTIRNSYLVKYVDPKQLVLVWDGLEEDKRQDYTDYRRYLLDYPETEGWYEQPPKTFEEWKETIQEPIELEKNEVSNG